MKAPKSEPVLKGKPQLPYEIRMALPREIVWLIGTFVPPYEKQKPPSPGLERELGRIQGMKLKGVSPKYMYALDDFILDDFVLDA